MPAASPVEVRLPAEMTGSALEVGRQVSVAAPATSANVGPGFDAFGLALDWRDRVSVEVIPAGYAVEVTGEGAAQLPRDHSHLIVASAIAGLSDLGRQASGLRLRAHNTVPHGRGLGSSSAAIVAGLLAARGLAELGPDRDWLLRHATAIEGHPDNVAAAIYGGFVVAFSAGSEPRVAQIPVHPDVSGWMFVADEALATTHARTLLPASIPHADAAANAARAALLVHALGAEPALLAEATRDWLHQEYRRPAMPASYALLADLRRQGWAAVISGAGPSVLVLGRTSDLPVLASSATPGFNGRAVQIGTGGLVESAGPDDSAGPD